MDGSVDVGMECLSMGYIFGEESEFWKDIY